ncbi:MAG: peptidoglycan DD-metalloendopeptidase family protein [Candidatus Sigynarchaeota archaeon]
MKSRRRVVSTLAIGIVITAGVLFFSWMYLSPSPIDTDEEPGAPVVCLPVKHPSIISSIGSAWGQLIMFGMEERPHEGVDLNLPDNTEIIACHDGIVASIWLGDYGPRNYQIYLKINEYWQVTNIFEPATDMTIEEMRASVFVQVGQQVKQGQVIGVLKYQGHLHWDIQRRHSRNDPNAWYRVNPCFYLDIVNYTATNTILHSTMWRDPPDTHSRIYDLVMFPDAFSKISPEFCCPVALINVTSIRPFGVPNPTGESSYEQSTRHLDLDFNVTASSDIIAPSDCIVRNITAFKSNSLNILRIDVDIMPGYWLRLEYVPRLYYLSPSLLLGLSHVSIGQNVSKNQLLMESDVQGGILHLGLARYMHGNTTCDPATFLWDNPSWFFESAVLADVDAHYQGHDLEGYRSTGFPHVWTYSVL